MGKSGKTEAKDCTGFWEKIRSSAGNPSENNGELLGPLASEDRSTSRENSGKRGRGEDPESTRTDWNTDRGFDEQ